MVSPQAVCPSGTVAVRPSYKAVKAPCDAALKRIPCEMVRYGEIAALISGITSVQGTPNRTCNKGLVRNIENQNELPTLSPDHIRTAVLSIASFQDTVDFTKTRSFVPHIAEGIGETPRKEFDVLKAKGLLRSETAIIHGTAFGEAEFAEMGRVGAKLIWSPQSNLALYAQTTQVPLALKHGVEVSLGVDWNPSGSDTMFEELRVAKQVDEEQWGNVIGDVLLVQMITSNPPGPSRSIICSGACSLGGKRIWPSFAHGTRCPVAVSCETGWPTWRWYGSAGNSSTEPRAWCRRCALPDVRRSWCRGRRSVSARPFSRS